MKWIYATVLAAAAPLTAAAQSADVLLDCSSCHVEATAPFAERAAASVYPDLAGQPVRYLQRQLEAYREGLRQHQQMQRTAVALGDGDAAMARLYADMPVPTLVLQAAPEDFPAAVDLVENGDWSRGLPACSSCHGMTPEDQGRLAPRLHGQPEHYVGGQLQAYADGTRQSDPMGRMRSFASLLSATEKAELAAYYAAWKREETAE